MSEEFYLMDPRTDFVKFLTGKQGHGEINKHLTKILRTNPTESDKILGRGQGNPYVFVHNGK